MSGTGTAGSSHGLFPRIAVVLLRPKSPGNVGSVARAMKNMGFTRLVIADPIARGESGAFETEAKRLAWGAADVLHERLEPPDLDTALAPFTFVAGTTSRPPEAARVLPPRRFASEIARRARSCAGARIALLFGQEDIGLTREHLARCNLLGTIPSSDLYPSLNLAQAALLFLYELRPALLAGPPVGGAPGGGLPERARIESFYSRLEEALDAIDFFEGTARAHMMRELRTIFNRAILTPRELAIFEGMVHQIRWAARRGR